MTDISLLHGWLPATVAVVAWGTLAFGVAWWRRALWQWPVIAGTALLMVVIVQTVFDVPRLVGGTYPSSFVIWAALPLFACAVAVWQWPRVAIWRRAVAFVSVPGLLVFGALQINSHYGYLPTVGDALGQPLPGQVSAGQLQPNLKRHFHLGRRETHVIAVRPRQGEIAEIKFPPIVSHFRPRAGYVWVPPAYFETPRPQLPVLILISGTPGNTTDWLRGGGALDVANEWASEHGGIAPIMVFPDANGTTTGDTECVDGARGNAETYLTVDVPNYMHAHFGVSLDRERWAIAGLSEGGTCALDLVARHPDRFATFADFSGDSAPTLGAFDTTLRLLYGGSRANMEAHDPTIWFAKDATAHVEGIIAVGRKDQGHRAQDERLADIAQHAGLRVKLDLIAGGHNFRTWRHALDLAYPWLVYRLEGPTGIHRPANL